MKKLFLFFTSSLLCVFIYFIILVGYKNEEEVNTVLKEIFDQESIYIELDLTFHQNFFFSKKMQANLEISEIDASIEKSNLNIYLEVKDFFSVRIIGMQGLLHYQDKTEKFYWSNTFFSDMIYELLECKMNRQRYNNTFDLNYYYERENRKLQIKDCQIKYDKNHFNSRLNLTFNGTNYYLIFKGTF